MARESDWPCRVRLAPSITASRSPIGKKLLSKRLWRTSGISVRGTTCERSTSGPLLPALHVDSIHSRSWLFPPAFECRASQARYLSWERSLQGSWAARLSDRWETLGLLPR